MGQTSNVPRGTDEGHPAYQDVGHEWDSRRGVRRGISDVLRRLKSLVPLCPSLARDIPLCPTRDSEEMVSWVPLIVGKMLKRCFTFLLLGREC